MQGMLDEQSLAELRRQQSAPVRFSPAPTPIDMLLGGGLPQGRPPAAGGLVSRVPGGTTWGSGAAAYDAYARAQNAAGTNPYASPLSMRRQLAGTTPKFSGSTLKAEQVLRDSYAALSRMVHTFHSRHCTVQHITLQYCTTHFILCIVQYSYIICDSCAFTDFQIS